MSKEIRNSIFNLSEGSSSGSPSWTPQLSSLIVANDDPTKVVLTFGKVVTVMPADSAFALAGKVISEKSLSGAGEILTFTVTVGYDYGDNPILVYDKPNSNPLKDSGEYPSFLMTGTNTVNMTVEYLEVYNALTTKPSTTVAKNQNYFVSDLVVGAVWSDIDSMRMLAQTINTANEALGDWKDPTKIATLHGTTPPAFTAGVGFQMLKSAARYIDLLWKPSDGVNHTLNNASIFFYRTNAVVNEVGGYDVGCYDGTQWSQVFRSESGAFRISEGVVNGGIIDRTIADPVGLSIFNRINATHQQIFHKGIQQGVDEADTAQAGLSTNSMWLGARHDPSATTSPSSHGYALVGFGKALTPTKVGVLTNSFDRYYKYGKNGDLRSPFIQTDFSDTNLATLRTTLRGRIWPGGYPATGKDSTSVGVASPLAADSANLASVDQLSFTITGIAARTPYVWHPTVSNGKFVIWHLDHFGTATGSTIWEELGRADCIRALIDEGYTVCGIYMPPSNAGVEGGGHSYPTVAAPYQTVTDLHYFLDTAIRVLNEYAGQFSAFYIAGHSGGGFTTTMIAALDERITKSFANAGTLPLLAMAYLLHPQDWEQQLPGLTDLIDYGDLYAMGCTSGRSQRQNLNANEDPTLTGFNLATYKWQPYETQMAVITSNFKLLWDSVTTTHIVSASTRVKIIAFFNS